jgi:hypothetical protein
MDSGCFCLEVVGGDPGSCYLQHHPLPVTNISASRKGMFLDPQVKCFPPLLLQVAEPVFLNVYKAPESIPRNGFRQPM